MISRQATIVIVIKLGKYDKIDSVARTLKGMLQSGDPQLSSGVSKFIARFDKLSAPRLRPTLASEFHNFDGGWV